MPVSGAAVQKSWAPNRAADNLVHISQLHLAIALAAETRIEMTRPQTLRLHLLLQRRNHRARGRVPGVVGIAMIRKEQIDRLAFVLHEIEHPVELGLELWFDGKVHGDPP